MVAVPLGSLPGGESGDQRPGFLARLGALPSAALTAPPQSPPSMPLKATFLRVSGPLSPSQGSSQEFAALP